ncbi:MAG: tyrosine-type recombinase/integrase [Proteobacteria bacterium]|nr:tyrosine-type recombinase/integrase [Pseudomonadota bacterium]
MPKIAKPLTAIEVKRLEGEGFHMVGTVAGLGLRISTSGARSWILRTQIKSRRTDMGLGAYPATTLARAHELARAAKHAIKDGRDPIDERRDEQSANEWNFQRCAESYIKKYRLTWKSNKHAQQWENTLATYAYPKIGKKPVRNITMGDVLSVIEPDWVTKTETMNRVRQRLEAVLAWAAVNGYRDKYNPAVWHNNIAKVLPKPKGTKAEPHPALKIKDVQAFGLALNAAEGEGAKCLHFLMLTACRSNEARGATWSEIDSAAAEWLIPAERMKADAAHRVPLSDAAVTLLKSLVKREGTDLIFVGNENKQLSDMTLAAVIKRMNKPQVVWADHKGKPIVPHGLRSTFATWAQEHTNYPTELREHALAHRVGNAVTQSYERGDQLEKRRAMMQDWARFVHRAPRDNVTSIRGAA